MEQSTEGNLSTIADTNQVKNCRTVQQAGTLISACFCRYRRAEPSRHQAQYSRSASILSVRCARILLAAQAAIMEDY